MPSNYPADGWGVQSQYYDEELLLNGSYEVISVTLDKDSRDTTNTTTTTLRTGLLLAKRSDGKYEPLSTADGYLNGTPTQYMKDVVVLGFKFKITTHLVKGVKKLITAQDLIVPAYWACNLKETRCFYNNSTEVSISDAQWNIIGDRIYVVPTSIHKFTGSTGELRNLPGIQNIATI